MSWDTVLTNYLAGRLADKVILPSIRDFNTAALIVRYLDDRFALGKVWGTGEQASLMDLPEGIRNILRMSEASSTETRAALREIANVAYVSLSKGELAKAKQLAVLARSLVVGDGS